MHRRVFALSTCLGLLVMLGSSVAVAQYQLTNLVSNQVKWATHIDPLQVNGWGLVYGPGGPFWVSDNGSGWSTLYDGAGVEKGLKVEIGTATGGGVGSPTGIVFNGTSDFKVNGQSSVFIFATLDGTIAAWAPGFDRNNATIMANASVSGTVYTGLAISNNASGNFLYAADVANGKVDMYDTSFTLKGSFTDPGVPAGFTPFGIADINGQVFVAFADSAGGPGGVIDIFNEQGKLQGPFATGRPLNQPWGFAVAPANFGPLSNTLLISNNTDHGTINAFSLKQGEVGKFVGTVRDADGRKIHIDQLWGIMFGGGSANNGATNELFFTAGPANNLAGTFGKIAPK
jgi:uncharacterized protein (TIGR03118 family)